MPPALTPAHHYDYYAGVQTRRQRVTEALRGGRPVADDDAVYEAAPRQGTGGYDCYTGCPVLREIGTEMSDLLLTSSTPTAPSPLITHCSSGGQWLPGVFGIISDLQVQPKGSGLCPTGAFERFGHPHFRG